MDGVAELADRADEKPAAVLDSLDGLRDVLETGTTFERNKAALALARVADAYPEEAAVASADLAASLDHDEAAIRYHAAIALARIAAGTPEAVRDRLPDLAARLDERNPDPDADVREMAALAIDNVAEGEPAAVGTVVPELAAALSDDVEKTRRYAAAALRRVAKASPESVTPAAPDLLGRLDDEATVAIALEAVGHLIDDYEDDVREGIEAAVERGLLDPGALEDAVESLDIDLDVDLEGSGVDPGTATQRESTRSLSADIDAGDSVDELADLAESNPERVRSELDTLREGLRSESDTTRNRAAIACKRLAESHPQAAGDLIRELGDRLDDDRGPVRYNAAFAIQNLAAAGEDRVLGVLDGIAESLDDPKSGVRDSATKALFAVASDHPDAVRDAAPGFHDGLMPDGELDPSSLRGYATTEALRTGTEGLASLGDTPSFEVDRPCSFCYFTISRKVWGCPHAAADGHDRCPFHLGAGTVPDSAVADAFLRAVNRPGEHTKEFYGARLGSLDVSFEAIDADDNYPITLTNATFEGSVDLSNSTIHHDLYLNGATFEAPLKCTSAGFNGWMNCEGATFEADGNFSRTRFLGQTNFEDVTFEGDASFVRAEFSRRTDFEACSFRGDAVFPQSKFRMAAHFSEASIDGEAQFESTTFEGRVADFDDVDFGGETAFGKATFDTPARFTGATFGAETSLYGVTFTDSALLTDARFDADLDCDGTTFDGLTSFRDVEARGETTFDHATFFERAVFWDAAFGGQVSISESEAANTVDCTDAAFDSLSLAGSTFDGALDLTRTETAGELDFSNVRAAGQVTLDGAAVDGTWQVERAEFLRGISTTGANFAGSVTLTDATVAGGDFDDASFEGPVSLTEVTVTAPTTFSSSTFGGPFTAELTCESSVSFRDAEFGDRTSFDGSTFAERVRFDDATLADEFTIRNARLADARFVRTAPATDDIATVDLTGTRFESGRIVLPATPMVYDLTDGTLGDVTLDGPDGISLFDSLRFVNTTFDGFGFGPHKDTLAALDWRLHTGHDGTQDLSPGVLENTYLNAKNGASAAGDDTAAAEFFIKEMAYRRRKHARGARTGGSVARRVGSGWKWFSNLVLDVCCGYGERPSRTILSSFATIGGFALVYALLGVDLPYEGTIGYLTFSVNAFVSLLLGTPTTSDAVVSLLVALQGFLGAFIIALFVFTLTRSVNR